MNFKLNLLFLLSLSMYSSVYSVDNINPDKSTYEKFEDCCSKVQEFVKNKPKYSALFLYGLWRIKEVSDTKITLGLRLAV